MEFNLYFDYAAVVIILILLSVYLIRPRFNNASAKIFQMLLACVFIASISEIITCKIIVDSVKTPLFFNYIIIGIYLYSINLCSILYYRYVVEITLREKIRKYEKYVFLFALEIDFLIIALTKWTKFVFYFDEENRYVHGPLFYMLYMISFTLLLIAGIKTYRYRKKLNRIQKFTVILFYVVNIGAILFEQIYTEINILTFVTAIYMFLLYVSLQNPEYYVDFELGCYNQEAFIKVCEQKISKSQKFAILSFYVDGYEYINQVFGVERGMELTKLISDYFVKRFRYDSFFHIMDSNFVYITTNNLNHIEKKYKEVWNDFNKIYEMNNVKISLQPRGSAILVPRVVNTAKDILDAVFYSQNKELPNDKGELHYLASEFLGKKHRKERIAQIIKENIATKGFAVYYLPIFDMKKKKIIGAEALVRIYDEMLGEIKPDEFIKIAEEYGLIFELDQLIFDKVCQFIHLIEEKKYEISTMEVNLSTIEIMQGESADQLLEVLKRNKVSPNKINFEIKESVCFALQEYLVKNMQILKEKGCSFSIDNYGVGISNVTDILKLDFDIIKIDKSLLWEAKKTKEARYVLESMVTMFKKLGYEVLITGVETKEQKEIAESLKADYIQGYIFSKPLKENEFLDLLSIKEK